MSYQIKPLIDHVAASTRAYDALETLQLEYEGVKDVIVVLSDNTVYSALGDLGRIEQPEEADAEDTEPFEAPVEYEVTGSVKEWGNFVLLLGFCLRKVRDGHLPMCKRGDVLDGLEALLKEPAMDEVLEEGGTLLLDADEYRSLMLFTASTVFALHDALSTVPGLWPQESVGNFIDRYMDLVPLVERSAVVSLLKAEGAMVYV